MRLGIPLEDRTGVERETRLQTPPHPALVQVSHVHPAPQKRAPHLQNKYKPSALNCRRAFQETPSEYLWLENQLGLDSGSCPVSSCYLAELVSLRAEQVPVLTECKLEHSWESSLERPKGTGPAPDAATVSDEQKHLQDISVEAGNQTSNYTLRCILTEKRKPPARAKSPHHSSNSRPQLW